MRDLANQGHPVTPDLIAREDFPPSDHYLPKPLSLEEDQQLQQQLRLADTLEVNALRLMRATGIRISECIHLPLDCLQQISEQRSAFSPVRIRVSLDTIRIVPHQLADHYRLRELRPVEDSRNPELVLADDDKAFSTLQTYASNLKNWILPRWGGYLLSDIKTVEVESWLKTLSHRRVQPTRLAHGTRAKIRAVMKTLFNHAKRYELFHHNPIALVRQSGRRRRIPEILAVQDILQLLTVLPPREFVMVVLDLTTGLRLSELFALQWQDFDFPNLRIKVVRSIVKDRVGHCKTEMSKKPVPLDPTVAMFMQEWHSSAVYSGSSDWVFASPETSGKKPYWGAPIMRKQIMPLAQRLGITRLEGWHTFRRTYSSLLTDRETHPKIVQELMRHASIRTTLDGYAQALTPSKRDAQSAVVSRLSLKQFFPRQKELN